MDQARSTPDFVLQPVGRLSLGANHLLWCHSPSLSGSVHQLPAWNRRIRRHAIVVPAGIVGGLLAGMLPLLQPRYSFRFFFSLASATAWLERPELPHRIWNASADEARVLVVSTPAMRDRWDLDPAGSRR